MSKLEDMLLYVSEHNDFYKNRIKEYGIENPLDITQWPILTRKELHENRYNMFSDGYQSKYFNQQLRRQSSSGSSGIPVNVYWDYKDWYASNMSLWRKRLQWYGIKPSDRYVSFELQSPMKSAGNEIYYTNQPLNILNISISSINKREQFKNVISLLEKFQPKWLYIRPFILQNIVDCYIRYCYIPPKSLRFIETHGEILTEELKKKATSFFRVPIANMYGSEEMNGIAFECPYQHMHILEDNVYVELDNSAMLSQAKSSNIIITNLNNKAMPIIRYKQGDVVALDCSNEQLLCGEHTLCISVIEGRSTDFITLEDDNIMSSMTCLEIMGKVNNYFNGAISFYRFVFRKKENLLICEIIINLEFARWSEEIIEAIGHHFRLKVPEHMNIKFVVTQLDSYSAFEKKIRIFEVLE